MGFSGHHARKRFGQHWLRDESVLQRIIEAADLQSTDRVLEVGPGRGALTERLLAAGLKAVHAIELDRDLVDGLQERFEAQPGFSLHQGDVLEAPLELSDGRIADKVVANIPYNITGPLLERLVGRLDRPVDPPYQRLVLLVQKEVAERIRARPGHSSFSALSVRMQLLARCRSVCPVPPRCFPATTKGAIGSDLPGALAGLGAGGAGSGRSGGIAVEAGVSGPAQDVAQHPGGCG